jgi:hypothetical protein
MKEIYCKGVFLQARHDAMPVTAASGGRGRKILSLRPIWVI